MPLTTQPPFRTVDFIMFCAFFAETNLTFVANIYVNGYRRPKTWLKSSVANLWSYAPTGIYYARPRIKGKVKVKCLKTDKLTVAKQRLADFLREEHR